MTESVVVHTAQQHRAQLEAILRGWGMAEANAGETADLMFWADLHGIDSHGISMLPTYDRFRREGRLKLANVPHVVRETAISALIDGDGGLGHVAAALGMRTAIAKARQGGVGVVAVRNSVHFGACGAYGVMAAEAGFIGMVGTTSAGVRVAPTGGTAARLSTDPWCFAAPGEPGRPFLLDMATTTVAYGRVRNRINEGQPTPPGWVLTASGQPSTDPLDVAERGGFLSSLGGSREGSSYKGYGLAMMVDILAGGLSGVTYPSDAGHTQGPGPQNVGHFLLALDPGMFGDAAGFTAGVARFCDAMRHTPPAEPDLPVLVAGDPERAKAARRRSEGIPVGPGLLAQVRGIAEAAGAPWLLD